MTTIVNIAEPPMPTLRGAGTGVDLDIERLGTTSSEQRFREMAPERGVSRNQTTLAAGTLSRGGDLANEIRRVWAERSANTLELVKVVRRARKELKRAWAEFWRTSQMPFSKRKADMLVGIARLDGISEQIFAQPSRGRSILYQLARLEHDQLGELVRDGTVHPHLTLREAKELVRRACKSQSSSPKRPPVKAARVNKFANFVLSTLSDWSPGQIEWTAHKLRDLLWEIECKREVQPDLSATAANNTNGPTN